MTSPGPQPPVPGQPSVPGPPPGPGVRPPFAAAPVEGRQARTWLGLGVAGAVLVLCCGAGIAAMGGVLVTGVEAINEQAQAAAADYLDAEAEQEWQEAYEQRCPRDRQSESLQQFTDRVSQLPRIESYELEEADISASGRIRVPAEMDYADGSQERLRIPLEQDPQTGMFEVCGLQR